MSTNDDSTHPDNNNNNNNNHSISYGIAIVGCGQIVTHHLDAILFSPPLQHPQQHRRKFHIVAICDPSIERRNVALQQIHQL
jgi:predicted dehydrogenase